MKMYFKTFVRTVVTLNLYFYILKKILFRYKHTFEPRIQLIFLLLYVFIARQKKHIRITLFNFQFIRFFVYNVVVLFYEKRRIIKLQVVLEKNKTKEKVEKLI